MIKLKHILLSVLLPLLLLTGCYKEEQFDNTPMGNFEACWKILDQHYCFFSYKKAEYGLDWDDVYVRYKQKIAPAMTRDSLFNVLNAMMCELRDGHVNLYTSFNVGRYWEWFTQYPDNFYTNLQEKYIGYDYRIAGGLRYKMLSDSIGYIFYPSFSSGVSDSNLNEVLYYFRHTKGLIFDIRNNGGGMLTNVNKIAARFTRQPFCPGYIQHKNGPGRDDFSSLYPLEQSGCPVGLLCYEKPVMILTNRRVYSAANQFVSVMSQLPNITTVGDQTGGGSGMPFSSELPIGWSIRFSASPIYNAQKEHTEFGITPDIAVYIEETDALLGLDTIIETAIERIKNPKQQPR